MRPGVQNQNSLGSPVCPTVGLNKPRPTIFESSIHQTLYIPISIKFGIGDMFLVELLELARH